MARIRTIKPEFWDSPDTAKAGAVARLLFIAMWNWADDHGRGTANLKELEGFAFPNDDIEELSGGKSRNFRDVVAEVSDCYGIVFYKVDGRPYYEIPSWEAHQRNEKRAQGKHPTAEHGVTWDVAGNHEASTQKTRKPSEAPRISDPGTGEQGNRGTVLSSEPDGSDSEPNRVDVKRLTDLLVDSLKARNVKTPTSLKAWNTEARRLLDIDKRPLDEALRVLAWSQQDEFWSKNILAMSKFRAKYDQLRLKADTWQPPVGPADRLKAAWRDGYDRELDQLASEPFYIEWPDPMPLDRDGFRLKAWRSWIESRHDELLRKLEARGVVTFDVSEAVRGARTGVTLVGLPAATGLIKGCCDV